MKTGRHAYHACHGAVVALAVACSKPPPASVADTAAAAVSPAQPASADVIPTAADWSAADSATVRLSPTAFPELPASVTRALLARRCTVPQAWDGEQQPHNVIRGEFARRGQSDWAVLCSRDHHSTVLVFWNGSGDSVAVLGSVPDAGFLQGVGDNRIGFSRIIGVVKGDYILDHYREYGGPQPPPIDHDGIEDAFAGKASVIVYFYKGEWLTLTGAD